MEKKEPKQFVILAMACERHTQSKQRTNILCCALAEANKKYTKKKKTKRKQNDASAYVVRIC